jgi:hypothetical protein
MSCASKRFLRILCLGVLTLAPAGRAAGQTPHQVVPLLTNTDQLLIDGSPLFGIPIAALTNDAGDLSFLGTRGTGIYYRKAGTPTVVRVLQYGDELPGFPGSRMLQALTTLMNANGLVIVNMDVATTGRITRAIVSYDGATLKTIVTGFDTAPGSGGAKYARSISLKDVNANGDVLFTSDLLPIGSTAAVLTTAFLAPAAGGVVRVAGPGDASPVTGGTFTTANGIALNNAGEVLLQAPITGGSGTNGVFVWTAGVLRKVVANGDANPLGGTFTNDFATSILRMTNSGLVMFDALGSFFQNTLVGGTTVAVAVNSAAPAPMNGTFSSFTSFPLLGQGGDAVFFANVAGGASASGLFRFRAGSGVEMVARLGETAPSGGGKVFSAIAAASVNATGTVSFQGSATSGVIGLFQKPAGGALAAVALQGDPSPVGGTLFFNTFPTQTLTNGAVFTRAHVMNFSDSDSAHHGAFVFTGGLTTALMSTADQLPAGARLVLRPLYLTGAGNYIGVSFHNAGGRETLAILNVVAQQGGDIGTDGDFVNGIGGRLLLNVVNTVMVNAAGHAAFQANLMDGGIRPIVMVGSINQPSLPAFFNGIQDTNGRTLFSPALADSLGVRPIAINSLGQVAFTATFNNNRGVWVGTAGGTPVKVAINGDLVSTGAAITSINQVHGGISQTGRVLFTANTAAGQGLFVAAPGATPLKVAQVGDAAPGGGTFSTFGTTPTPSFNNQHQVAFVATVTGGSGNGVYVATLNVPGTAYTVEAIALTGGASPAGGTFSITTPLGGVVINDAGAVAFQAELSGGASDSGLFIRRSAISALETIVAQGQAAPGTASTFQTFEHGTNNLVGENFQVSSTGQVAFRGFVTPPGGTQIFGYWHLEPSGAMQPITMAPSTIAAYDGGTATSQASTSTWMFGDRYPMWVPLANGPHTGGLYMYVPIAPPVVTGAGPNVTVHPVDSLTTKIVDVTFANVSGSGTTTLERVSTGPVLPPAYITNVIGQYYNVSTTAVFSGTVTVCIDFTDLQIENLPPGVGVHLLQYQGGVWQNVSSGPPVNSVICGVTNSLGTFSVAAFFGAQSDILWRHDTRGEVWRWSLNGAVPTSQTFISTVDPIYEIVGRGDYNGDGNFDILWRHKNSGDIWIWLMNGDTPLSQTFVDTVDPNYEVAGSGDYNGDRKADILWRHKTNGEVWIWLMNGVTSTARTHVDTVPVVYAIAGSGDLDGDAKSDIIWRHTTTGDVWVWLMDGTARLSQALIGTVPDLGYEIVGVANYTDDENADILWRHATAGHVWIWDMFGNTVLQQMFVGTVDPVYRIVGTSDYDFNGLADILWHHSTVGDVWVWMMEGPNVVSQTLVGKVPDIGYKIVKGK